MKRLMIIAFLMTLFSCKKDKLENDKSIFIGKWNWEYTFHNYGICDGDNFSETITPETEGSEFSIHFFEKGIVKFYQNDELLSSDRVILTMYPAPCSGDLPDHQSFYISLNNKDSYEANFYGCVDTDEITVIKGFPFNLIEETGCEFYTSYFIKE